MTTSYPVSTIAKLFGLTERRVQQLAKDGIIAKLKKNQYELVGSVRAYINYLQRRAFGKGAALFSLFIPFSLCIYVGILKKNMWGKVTHLSICRKNADQY